MHESEDDPQAIPEPLGIELRITTGTDHPKAPLQ
jgi:hypothetical protein